MNNKPVAWMYRVNNSFNTFSTIEPPDDAYDEGTLVPLYTHTVKELTDEEIYRLLADSIWAVGLNTDCLDEQNWADGITVARAILSKAQEK